MNGSFSRDFRGKVRRAKGDVDIVMAIAATSIELRITQLAGCEDASSASPIGQMLKAKAFRTLGNEVAESFVEFREIAGVPDICEAVLQKQISIAVGRLG